MKRWVYFSLLMIVALFLFTAAAESAVSGPAEMYNFTIREGKIIGVKKEPLPKKEEFFVVVPPGFPSFIPIRDVVQK